MKCEEVIDLMHRELDADLGQEEQQVLFEHLSSCYKCQALFERLKKLSSQLEALPKVEPPISIVDQILPILDQIDTAEEQQQSANIISLPEKKKTVATYLLKNKRYWISGAVVAAGLFTFIVTGNVVKEETANDMAETAQVESAATAKNEETGPISGMTEEEASFYHAEVVKKSKESGVDSSGDLIEDESTALSQFAFDTNDSTKTDEQGGSLPGNGQKEKGQEQPVAQAGKDQKNNITQDPKDPKDPNGTDSADGSKDDLIMPEGSGEENEMGITVLEGKETEKQSPDGIYTASMGIDHEYIKINKGMDTPHFLSHIWEKPWVFHQMEWISDTELYYILSNQKDGELQYWLIDAVQREEKKLPEPIGTKE